MTTSTGHFNVSQKTATALGLDVISILPHVVSVRTDKGPRFVSRKRFDEFERQTRYHRARNFCNVKQINRNAWEVIDTSTKSGAHIVSRSDVYTETIKEKWHCTCGDARFMEERGQELCCKHIFAVRLTESVKGFQR